MTVEDLYKKGMTLYKRKKYTWALQLLTQAAEQGYTKAMEELGSHYFFSTYNSASKNKDMEKAFYWLSKAMENEDEISDTHSYYCIAYCYKWGDGVKRNEKKVYTYLRKGAMKGNSLCIHCVAQCYELGIGVKQNFTKALQWYKKHTKTEDGWNSMVTIGDYYYKGIGTEQNHTKAAEWYMKASEQGYSDGHYKLGICYQNGTGVPKDFDKALDLLEKAFMQSNPDAEKILVDLLKQRCPRVVDFFERLATRNHWFAIEKLQEMRET